MGVGTIPRVSPTASTPIQPLENEGGDASCVRSMVSLKRVASIGQVEISNKSPANSAGGWAFSNSASLPSPGSSGRPVSSASPGSGRPGPPLTSGGSIWFWKWSLPPLCLALIWIAGFLFVLLSISSTWELQKSSDRRLPQTLASSFSRHSVINASRPFTMTIFTAPRAFEGVDDARQRRALLSWLRLYPTPTVVLMGMHPSFRRVAAEFPTGRVVVEPDVDTTFLGTPLFHSMVARARAAPSDVAVLVHPDLIILQEFSFALEKARHVSGAWLMVAARWVVPEFPFDAPSDAYRLWLSTKNSSQECNDNGVAAFVRERGKLQKCKGVDLWAWDVGSAPLHMGVMPPFMFRMGRYDQWLISEAINSHVRRVIDASDAVMTVHVSRSYDEGVLAALQGFPETMPPRKEPWGKAVNYYFSLSYGSFSFRRTTLAQASMQLLKCKEPGSGGVCVVQRRPCRCRIRRGVQTMGNVPLHVSGAGSSTLQRDSASQRGLDHSTGGRRRLQGRQATGGEAGRTSPDGTQTSTTTATASNVKGSKSQLSVSNKGDGNEKGWFWLNGRGKAKSEAHTNDGEVKPRVNGESHGGEAAGEQGGLGGHRSSETARGKVGEVLGKGCNCGGKESLDEECLPPRMVSPAWVSSQVELPFSLEQLLERLASPEKVVVLTVVAFNYVEFVMSFVCRLKKLHIYSYVIGAIDEEAYRFCAMQGLPVFRYNVNANSGNPDVPLNNCHFGTRCFQDVTKMKSRTVVRILDLGYSVLFSDVDVFWFSDPIPTFLRRTSTPGTILVQSDNYQDDGPDNEIRRINSGFYFVRTDPSSIAAFRAIVKHAETSDMTEQPSFYDVLCGYDGEHRVGDSACVNEALNVTVDFLDRIRYPNGASSELWEKRTGAECKKRGCIVIHNNWVNGRHLKLTRQIEQGLWEFDLRQRMCVRPWHGPNSMRVY